MSEKLHNDKNLREYIEKYLFLVRYYYELADQEKNPSSEITMFQKKVVYYCLCRNPFA